MNKDEYRRRNSVWSCSQTWRLHPPHQKLFDARSTRLLDGFLILAGNVLQIAQEASGWIRFALSTISVHRLICGDVPRSSRSFRGDATVPVDYAMTYYDDDVHARVCELPFSSVQFSRCAVNRPQEDESKSGGGGSGGKARVSSSDAFRTTQQFSVY